MFGNFDLIDTILTIPGILIGFTFHEFAHAYVADKLGDKTPKFQGRLTLNPIAHIDPIGFIMILLVHIGWAKPVQTNPSAFKHYYKDDLKVSLAGPVANLFIAFIFTAILALCSKSLVFTIGYNKVTSIILVIIQSTIWINCILAVFNLIPIPGLDGFHILRDLAPEKFYKIADTLYKYQFIILIAFILGLADFIVVKPAQTIFVLFLKIFGIY